MKKSILLILFFSFGILGQSLKISTDNRAFATSDGKPFFWLGDTAWLLVKKCSRDDTVRYLDTRKAQGFNVIQVMLLPDVKNTANFYGKEALVNADISRPLVTPGNDFGDPNQYDYWDHVEWIVRQAGNRGIFTALVPVWGSNGKLTL